MTAPRFLPQRWRQNAAIAGHAQAIAGILDTPPIEQRQDGLVLFASIGSTSLLPAMVALKSLWRPLQRGRVALLDDGSLTAEDRAVLAHHFADPELVRADTVNMGSFPAGQGWESLLTMLERRGGEYWLRVAPDSVTLGDVPEIAGTIGANRSLTDLSAEAESEHPLPFAEAFRSDLPRMDRWRYLDAGGGLTGLAAGQGGRAIAEAALALLPAPGPNLTAGKNARRAAGFIVANEIAPVCLPRTLYRSWKQGEDWRVGPAFLRFAEPKVRAGAWADASRAAIALLAR